ncbi:MAG: hypothetical protein IJL71_06110, partial [Oscillospiraceae bacterium]|nr:hypothetical protein [Oscillospiraceae bacterium]
AHEYKHYSGSGTGLRSLVDTYVYLRRFEGAFREDYIADECENLGISEFEKRNRSLSMKLFGGEPLTETDREMLDYILFSGTFGTKSNREKNLLIKKGRPGYLVYRAFPPYRSMARRFPVLNSAPVLLPVFWIVRIFRAFIKNPAEMMRRIKGAFKNKK